MKHGTNFVEGERMNETPDTPCPRCGNDVEPADIIDGRCGECRLHEDEADWPDETEGPLN